METRPCYNCGRAYAVVKDDALLGYNERSPWLEDVCKRCICYLRQYHKWTVTDYGLRLCAACFLPRHSLADTLKYAALHRKREPVPPGERK